MAEIERWGRVDRSQQQGAPIAGQCDAPREIPAEAAIERMVSRLAAMVADASHVLPGQHIGQATAR